MARSRRRANISGYVRGRQAPSVSLVAFTCVMFGMTFLFSSPLRGVAVLIPDVSSIRMYFSARTKSSSKVAGFSCYRFTKPPHS
ncbi:UNVERIFIED_CONTAM: hypothetical protein Sangu_1498400 [Sesamum angustifolium]|uniref:Transmembrane protein n=1 Tax=Sesamum angustifolium TaxID=2727405 RepID=A0AAW2MP40_9LAMI